MKVNEVKYPLDDVSTNYFDRHRADFEMNESEADLVG